MHTFCFPPHCFEHSLCSWFSQESCSKHLPWSPHPSFMAPVHQRYALRSAEPQSALPALQGGGASHLGAHADWGGGAGGAVARLTATCTLRFVLKSYEQTDRTLCAFCVKGSPWGFHWVSPLLRSLPTLSSCSV